MDSIPISEDKRCEKGYFATMKRIFIHLYESVSKIDGILFMGMTFFVNLFVLIISLLFHLLEAEKNPLINGLLDSIWWAFATVTTVGYGDIVPVTPWGKILGIFLMLFGTAVFAIYIAVLANFFLEDHPGPNGNK